MAFNADEYLRALEHPTFTLNGKTYVGRILSIEQWMVFENRFQALVQGSATQHDALSFAKDYLRAVFPYKWSYRWHGDPVTELLNSPALIPTLDNFLALQVTVMAGKTLPPKTNGTNSEESL